MHKVIAKPLFLMLLCILFIPVLVIGCGGSSSDGGGSSPTSSPTASPTVSPTVTPTGSGNAEITAIDFATGDAIQNAAITINTISGTTDSLGKCTLQGIPAGTKILTATASGYADYQTTITIEQDQTTALEIILTPADIPTPEPGTGNIIGYVKNSNGTGLAGVKCTITPKGMTVRETATTDRNGRYLFLNVAPGTYFITFSLTNYSFSSVSVTVVQDTNNDATESTGTYTGGGGTDTSYTIDGTVTDLYTNATVQGANVEIYYTTNGEKSKDRKTPIVTSDTDANGKYALSGIAPGEYLVVATKDGKTTANWFTVVNSDVTSNITLSWLVKLVSNDMTNLRFYNKYFGCFVGKNGNFFITTDGGNTWSFRNTGVNTTLNDVDFQDANNIWTTTTNFYYWSTNAGKSFSSFPGGSLGTTIRAISCGTNVFMSVTNNLSTLSKLYQFVALYLTNNTLGASEIYGTFALNSQNAWVCGADGKIARTPDCMWTWNQQVSGTAETLYGIHFNDASNGWAVGANGTIVHTVNGGTNWSSQVSGVNSILYSVKFVDNNNGWAVGENGVILHTTNGGANWSAQTSGTGRTLNRVAFANLTTGWVIADNGTVLYTTNGGSNWNIILRGISATSYIKDVYFTDANNGWITGLGSSICRTTDGGSTWTPQTTPVAGDYYTICFSDTNNGWAAGSLGKLVHTTNGGTNWVAQVSGTAETINKLCFVNASNGWAAATGGVILATADGGANWAVKNSGTGNNLNSVYFVNATTGWVAGAAGTIRKSTDGGENWGAQVSGTANALNSIYFVDANTGWVVGNAGTILKTTDGGANWNAQASGTANDLNGVHFSNSTFGWAVGTNGTVLYTTDGGANWVIKDSSLMTLNKVFLTGKNTGCIVGDYCLFKLVNGE
jgi:photosystem II stability/assembly factor-like uncharacterized protein